MVPGSRLERCSLQFDPHCPVKSAGLMMLRQQSTGTTETQKGLPKGSREQAFHRQASCHHGGANRLKWLSGSGESYADPGGEYDSRQSTQTGSGTLKGSITHCIYAYVEEYAFRPGSGYYLGETVAVRGKRRLAGWVTMVLPAPGREVHWRSKTHRGPVARLRCGTRNAISSSRVSSARERGILSWPLRTAQGISSRPLCSNFTASARSGCPRWT